MLKHFAYAVATTIALVLPTSFSTSGIAQDVASPIELPAVTQEQVLAACTAADAKDATCKAAIAAYFAYLKQANVVGADLEQLIATLVVALAEAPVGDEIKAVVVAAISDIGTNYATGEQAIAIQQIAETVEAGGTLDEATGALNVSGA